MIIDILVMYIYNSIDAFMRPPVSCLLHTAIIRQKKKDFGEIEKIEKDVVKRIFTLELRLSHLREGDCVFLHMVVYNYSCIMRNRFGVVLWICFAIWSKRWRKSRDGWGFGRINLFIGYSDNFCWGTKLSSSLYYEVNEFLILKSIHPIKYI